MAKKVFRSLIKKYFTPEILMQLDKLSRKYDIDNNTKSKMIDKLLEDNNIPFTSLGNGTNRYGILIDGYVLKVALDKAGKIDNRREFKYTGKLQPYVVKVYETNREGLLLVCEYVTIFSLSDFYDNQSEMRQILSDIAQHFLIGDIGVTSENYANWGFRNDGSICILDFAYIYALSYKQFTCDCSDDAILEYDNDFVNLICPRCNHKYSFGDIRDHITRKDEENEIGNVLEVGYVLKSEAEELEEDPAKSIISMVEREKLEEENSRKTKKKKRERFIKPKVSKQDFDLTPEQQRELLAQFRNN